MFQQQPMRNQPRPQAPQRPGRALMPRHPGMGMQPPQAQQRGLQQMFQPMGAERVSAEPEAALEAFRVWPIRLPFQICSAMFKKRSA